MVKIPAMYYSFFLVLFFAAVLPAQIRAQKKSLRKTQASVDSVISSVQGTVAVAFKDIASGTTITKNANLRFHSASTMKVPVMIEVYRQSALKKFSLNDSLIVKNEFRSIIDRSSYSLDIARDSDDSLYSSIGKKVSLRRLVDAMIVSSSNLATNLIIEKVGAQNVSSTMKKIGAGGFKVLRGVEDMKAFDAGKNNSTTAADLMVIMELLAKRRLISKKASSEMTTILLRQRFNELIPAELPAEVQVAHKTGNITGVVHDAAIIYLPDGRMYVLVVLTKDLKSDLEGKKAIAAISRIIYEHER